MAAIITDQFRRNSAATVLADLVAGTNKYYIGIGKTDKWDDVGGYSETDTQFVTPISTGSRKQQKEVRNNLMSLIEVTANKARIVVPNVPWTIGRAHKPYSENDPSAFTPTTVGSTTTYPCYAIADGKIWLCLKSNGSTLNAIPSGVSLYTEYTGATGYTWIAIANVEINSPFNTDQFIAVVLDDTQYEVGSAGETANDATKGRVYGFTVENGGTGYTGTPVAFLIGDGTATPIPLTITTDAGVITAVSITGTNTTTNFTNGSVRFTDNGGGSGAIITPNIAPLEGFAPTILNNLPTWFLGLTADFDGVVGGDAPIVPYRQISVIKNPEIDLLNDGVTSSADALKYLVIDDIFTGDVGDVMTATTSGSPAAKAFVDYFEVVGGENRLYYHQNDSSLVNYGSFGSSGDLSVLSGDVISTYAYTSVNESEYIHNTGEVLFIENRKPISRNENQKEEIKLVIQY